MKHIKIFIKYNKLTEKKLQDVKILQHDAVLSDFRDEKKFQNNRVILPTIKRKLRRVYFYHM